MEYYQKYKELKKENHIFTFTGNLNFQDVILLKEMMERIMILQGAESKQKRRVVNILIEALQNVLFHGLSESASASGRDCLLLLAREEKTYFLVFGNFILNDTIQYFENKLSRLNNMDMAELKQLYLEMLDKGEITAKGGASLGLVKMFLDCTKNCSYSFQKVDENYSFFTLELQITEN